MLGGLSLPGAGDSSPNAIPSSGSFAAPAAALAVPTDLVKIPPAGQSSSTLADLAGKGLFIAPLQAQDQVGYAALALGLDSKGPQAWPRDTWDHFSYSDGKMMLFINWTPKTKYTKASRRSDFTTSTIRSWLKVSRQTSIFVQGNLRAHRGPCRSVRLRPGLTEPTFPWGMLPPGENNSA